jgi:hypothetical protein
MAKPTSVPRWADTPTTLRTEPPEGQKDTGFAANSKLPAQYFNWLIGIAGDWLTWLNTRLFDEYTLPSVGNDVFLYGVTDEGLHIKDGAGSPAYSWLMCADPDGTNSVYAQMATTINWHDKYSCMAERGSELTFADGDEIVWDNTPAASHDPSGMLGVDGKTFNIPADGDDSIWHVAVNVVWKSGGTPATYRAVELWYVGPTYTPYRLVGLAHQSYTVSGGTPSSSFCGILGGSDAVPHPVEAGSQYRVKVFENETGSAYLTEARVTWTRIS